MKKEIVKNIASAPLILKNLERKKPSRLHFFNFCLGPRLFALIFAFFKVEARI
ncbi:unnamed protein product [Oikopleura dioica]|uniref:Uncharacterized protein n=1 Tax=Oikopleura dioica TaxID=34765 RepID=E4YVS9_OIKDI|nr:unnamed protein product [Oikopleura dioica]